jgi:hypothetical protein
MRGRARGGWDGHATYQSVGYRHGRSTQPRGRTPRASTDLGGARHEVSEQASSRACSRAGVNKRADVTYRGRSGGHGCAPLRGTCGPAVARIELRK